MPKDREKSEKKKKKTTSDDILASLVEEIRTVGPVEDISVLIKKDKKPKKEKKAKKSKEADDEPKDSKKADGSSKKHKRSKRSPSPDAKRRSRSPPAKRKRSATPERRSRRRTPTPPPVRKTENTHPFSRFTWGRARSRDREGLLPWERDRWSRSRSRSWSPTRYLRRDRSNSPRPREIDESRIDKHELLRIARKNVTRLAAEGRLPKGMELGSTLKNKSIRELIELCYEIQSRDFEVPVPESFVPTKDDEEDKSDFSTLPVRSIRIRIKDGAEKSTRSNLERMIEENALRSHFPISSGQTHKNTADKDWVPMDDAVPNGGIVSTLSKKTIKIATAYTAYRLKEQFVPKPATSEPAMAEPPADPHAVAFNGMPFGVDLETNTPLFLPPPPPPEMASFSQPATSELPLSVPEPAPLLVVSNEEFMAEAEEPVASTSALAEAPEATAPPKSPVEEGEAATTPPPAEFKMSEGAAFDKPVALPAIAGIVSRRARLAKELAGDKDNHALRLEIADIDLKLSLWAKTTSETSARFGAADVMIPQMDAARPLNSIWATKDTLRNAPVHRGGIGEHLLQRMGWQPGQGLGRKMDGPVHPLILDVKADRKGLHSTHDKAAPRREVAATLNGRNPVSVIMEYCAKHGLPPPLFAPIEDGPANQRRFGCKAVLNGVEYDAASASTNKKAAKAQVCFIMCQALGLK